MKVSFSLFVCLAALIILISQLTFYAAYELATPHCAAPALLHTKTVPLGVQFPVMRG